ncbi:MAG: SMC-Scp complex subunit ScpB [Verrucomicrobiota bacterium]
MTLSQVLEALIFAAPKPLSTGELLAAIQAAGASSETDAAQALAPSSGEDVIQALTLLGEQYDLSGRAFRLVEQASGWSLLTRPEMAPWVRSLYPEAKPARLSGPALETLAIIAYRQPVTRADIEAVRGVAVDGVMQVLLDRSLVRITGRADVPGRPLLYATTDYFLEHFGLKSTQELPNSAELGRMNLPKAPHPEEKGGRRKGAKDGDTTDQNAPELPFSPPDLSPAQAPQEQGTATEIAPPHGLATENEPPSANGTDLAPEFPTDEPL